MTRTMTDLTDALFAQLDRVTAANLDGEALKEEIARSQAVVGLADKIAHTADLSLKAAKLYAEHGQAVVSYLPQIGSRPGRAKDAGQ